MYMPYGTALAFSSAAPHTDFSLNELPINQPRPKCDKPHCR